MPLALRLATGQVAEFKVWVELVRQSMGRLHVPACQDAGVDAAHLEERMCVRLDRYRVRLDSLGSTCNRWSDFSAVRAGSIRNGGSRSRGGVSRGEAERRSQT